MAAKKTSSSTRECAKPRALLRKHVRITKRGRVKLQKGWSDKRIARKAKSKVALVRELRADLYNRIHEEVARAPQIGQ
jgi:hypothetical protein